MSTPEESFEIAADESSDEDAREQAISQLETANECDSLAELVRMGDLREEYRERALEGMAHPQCRSMLQSLANGDELSGSLRERAESLLEETAGESGAGPS